MEDELGREERREQRGREGGLEGFIEERLKKIDRKEERRERKERRRNVIIRDKEVKEGKEKEKLEELMKDIGITVNIEEIKRIGKSRRGKEMWWVRLGSEEQKMEVLRKKRGLKGRRERIVDDLIQKERKMKWRLEGIPREQEERGYKVWLGYGKIRIEVEWWFWDEKEILRDGRGRIRMEQGKREEKGGRVMGWVERGREGGRAWRRMKRLWGHGGEKRKDGR